jgi:ubiquinone/menaquinone biosynthesis C-methylase UbiE
LHDSERILGSYVTKGMIVLDVGCGMGFFSIAAAKLVGSKGCVIAADIQAKMLGILQKRSERAGVSNVVRLHKCEPDRLGVNTPVDFVIAFWMVHEVPDKVFFLRQIRTCLKANGKILVADPRYHVSLKQYHEILTLAKEAGLVLCAAPSLRFSHCAVLRKDPN